MEERMIEFRKKNHQQYIQNKGYSAKTDNKDESIPSSISISETDINDNVTSDNIENCLTNEHCIGVSSIASGL